MVLNLNFGGFLFPVFRVFHWMVWEWNWARQSNPKAFVFLCVCEKMCKTKMSKIKIHFGRICIYFVVVNFHYKNSIRKQKQINKQTKIRVINGRTKPKENVKCSFSFLKIDCTSIYINFVSSLLSVNFIQGNKRRSWYKNEDLLFPSQFGKSQTK